RSAPFTTVIFRDLPARAQSYVGERLEEEGWFGLEGWKIVDWFSNDKFSNGEPAVAGTGQEWAKNAWQRAYEMWHKYGLENGLEYLSAEDESRKKELAQLYCKKYNIAFGQEPVPLRPEDQNDSTMKESLEAYLFVFFHERYVGLGNFTHHLYICEAEGDPQVITSRRLFFEAEELRRAARREEALERYQD